MSARRTSGRPALIAVTMGLTLLALPARAAPAIVAAVEETAGGAGLREPAASDPSSPAAAPPEVASPEAASPDPVSVETGLPPTVSSQTVTLDTVVVTARDRPESLQAVPVSMVAIDGEAWAESGLSLGSDLPQRVSGLVASVPNPRLASFAIRGLGSPSYNDGIESSVGLFVDGVYAGRAGVSMFDLVDIERIEVLRGPQGTLFGKNTTAGAIHVLTRLPEFTFGSVLDASAGDVGLRQLRGSLTGPLVEGQLAGRLTGYLTRRDGLTTNVYDGSRLNGRDREGLRGQLLWTPAADLRARLITEWGRIDESCCAYPLVDPIPASILASDAYMEYTRISGDPQDRLADFDQPTRVDVLQRAASLEVAWDGGFGELTSLTAWRGWRFDPLVDDGTSLRLLFGRVANEHRQFSQELRWRGTLAGVQAIGGLFFMHQDIAGNERTQIQDQLTDWVFGGLLRESVPGATQSNSGLLIHALIPPQTLDGMVVLTDYRQRTDSLAGYGSLHLPITDTLAADLGARYTLESKRARVDLTRSGGQLDASPLALTNTLEPLGALVGVDLRDYTFDGFIDSVAGRPFSRRNSLDEGRLSGSGTLTQRLAPDWHVYATIARGYKSGGINLGNTGDTVQPTFAPERATTAELGSKLRLFGRRLDLALALYAGRIDGYQALTFDEDQGLLPNPRQNNILNVGRLRLRGVELEAGALPWPGLRLRTSVSYNEAITVDFRNAPNEDTGQNDLDLSGERLYNAPRWSWNAGLDYRRRLRPDQEFVAGVDHAYRGGAYATVEHGRASYIDAYRLTHVRLGWNWLASGWEAWLWARNVFDTEYVAAIQPVYGVGKYGGFAGDPRSYGLTLRWTY